MPPNTPQSLVYATGRKLTFVRALPFDCIVNSKQHTMRCVELTIRLNGSVRTNAIFAGVV